MMRSSREGINDIVDYQSVVGNAAGTKFAQSNSNQPQNATGILNESGTLMDDSMQDEESPIEIAL